MKSHMKENIWFLSFWDWVTCTNTTLCNSILFPPVFTTHFPQHLSKIPLLTCHFWKNYIFYQLIQWTKSSGAALSFINYIMAYQCSRGFYFLKIIIIIIKPRLFWMSPWDVFNVTAIEKNTHRNQISLTPESKQKSKLGSLDTDMPRFPCAHMCWNEGC